MTDFPRIPARNPCPTLPVFVKSRTWIAPLAPLKRQNPYECPEVGWEEQRSPRNSRLRRIFAVLYLSRIPAEARLACHW